MRSQESIAVTSSRPPDGRAVPATAAFASKTTLRAACVTAGVVSTVIALRTDAAIVNINLASAGFPFKDITGLNAGMTFGQSKVSVSNFVTNGRLEIFYNGTNGIGLDGDFDLQFAITGGTSSPRNYASGATIDSTATYSGTDTETFFYDGFSTPKTNVANFGAGSHVGFRFGSAGNFNYGYIEVRWTWTGTASTSTFELLSAAYESTANTAILAGATPIPAPSALALLALGGGAFRRARARAA